MVGCAKPAFFHPRGQLFSVDPKTGGGEGRAGGGGSCSLWTQRRVWGGGREAGKESLCVSGGGAVGGLEEQGRLCVCGGQ